MEGSQAESIYVTSMLLRVHASQESRGVEKKERSEIHDCHEQYPGCRKVQW